MDVTTTVLVCDSDQQRANALVTVLQFIGEECQCCSHKEMAERLQQSEPFVLIVSSDIETQAVPSQKYPFVPLIIIDDTLTHAAQAPTNTNNILGSLSEPFNYDELTRLLYRAQSFVNQLQHSNAQPSAELAQNLIGKGGAIQEIRHLIDQVAHTSANVLILGESGTGKEVVARAVHEQSVRSQGPFVPVNCGAIPAELLESELFGHEKGAFTGAFTARKGRFELAQGGTLFLDEIGDMPMPMQVKLLRVLQERVFERVGGNKVLEADIRIIAATHRNLERMINDGEFREDLYYRLNVFPIEVPALRERSDDIPLLLQELVMRHNEQHHSVVRFTQRSVESLMMHEWPGNIRELSNLVERLIILHPNKIVDVSELPPKYRHIEGDDFTPCIADGVTERDALLAIFSQEEEALIFPEEMSAPIAPEGGVPVGRELPEQGINLKEVLGEIEVDLIQQALEQQDGVVARAAEQLQMRRTTLVEKMKKYQLNK